MTTLIGKIKERSIEMRDDLIVLVAVMALVLIVVVDVYTNDWWRTRHSKIEKKT